MKKFLTKILILGVIPIIVCVALFVIIYKYEVANLKINESTSIIIMGDSHTQSGLDDDIIENSLNIAQSSEHFLYSYNILKLLKNNNTQIDKVILGVSFHSFSIDYDEQIYDEEKSRIMLERYFPILDLKSIIDTKNMPLKNIKGIYKNIIISLISDKYSFIGDFYESERSNLNATTINTAIQGHYYTTSGDEQAYANYQIKYLNKIVELCNDKNIELIIINTPIHKEYYNKIPKKFIINYYLSINQFKNKVKFYDLHSIELKDNYYGDGDHVNLKGAKVISTIINELINYKNNKQMRSVDLPTN